MKDFDHLMSVWQEQPKQDQLSVDDVLKQVKKGMSGISDKLLWGVIIMSSSFVGLFAVMIFFVFNSWITYVGIVILLITLLLYSLVMLRDYRLISKQDITINPAEYLQSLKEYQKSRAELYGWLFYLYVILISSGLVLYFYEVLQSASTAFKIIVYGISAIWLLFCTFFLKDRFVKNEQNKINVMIDRLIRLQDQFD
jgi:type IV secretory pathway TrbD component